MSERYDPQGRETREEQREKVQVTPESDSLLQVDTRWRPRG